VSSAHEFVVTGTSDEARDFVAQVCAAEGYLPAVTPNGSLTATRGSAPMTFWFGGMAGKNFHLRFDIQFLLNEHGDAVVKLSRSLGSGMLKGGAIGAAKTNNQFLDLARAIELALSSSGRMKSSTAL